MLSDRALRRAADEARKTRATGTVTNVPTMINNKLLVKVSSSNQPAISYGVIMKKVKRCMDWTRAVANNRVEPGPTLRGPRVKLSDVISQEETNATTKWVAQNCQCADWHFRAVRHSQDRLTTYEHDEKYGERILAAIKGCKHMKVADAAYGG